MIIMDITEKIEKNNDIVLLKAYKEESLVVEEVQVLLYHCSMSYASKTLGELWKKGYLKRRRVKRKKGGKKYKYTISEEGEKVAKWLQSQ